MKKINLIISFLAAVSTLLFNSCTKTTVTITDKNGVVTTSTTTGSNSNNNNNNNGNNSSAGVTYKIDGTSKAMTTVAAMYISSTNTFQLQAQIGTGNDAIGIGCNNFKVGTYDVATDGLLFTYSDAASLSTYMSESGKIIITAITSTTVTGTFEYVVHSISDPTIKKTITEGKFSVSYYKL